AAAEEAPIAEEIPAEEAAAEEAPAAEEMPEENYTEYPEGLSGIVLTEDMLYAAPGGEAIAPLGGGMQVMILAIGETWSKVRIDDVIGYIPTCRLSLYNEPAEVEDPIRSISLSANTRGKEILQIGMLITISAELKGFENDTYILQWQYSPDRGVTAFDIPGANDLSYSYYLSRQNAEYVYRLVVYVQEND
ncbi:MAG: hypothetical protein Q4G19_02470, partial [Clostridia bacterium]|nr:hypothetical protein [Clostridia bacterium]